MKRRLGGRLDTTDVVLVIDIEFIVTGGFLLVVWRRGLPRPQTPRHDGWFVGMYIRYMGVDCEMCQFRSPSPSAHAHALYETRGGMLGIE